MTQEYGQEDILAEMMSLAEGNQGSAAAPTSGGGSFGDIISSLVPTAATMLFGPMGGLVSSLVSPFLGKVIGGEGGIAELAGGLGDAFQPLAALGSGANQWANAYDTLWGPSAQLRTSQRRTQDQITTRQREGARSQEAARKLFSGAIGEYFDGRGTGPVAAWAHENLGAPRPEWGADSNTEWLNSWGPAV